MPLDLFNLGVNNHQNVTCQQSTIHTIHKWREILAYQSNVHILNGAISDDYFAKAPVMLSRSAFQILNGNRISDEQKIRTSYWTLGSVLVSSIYCLVYLSDGQV